MSALPHPEVTDTALRVLQPEDAPDDANLAESPWEVTDERAAEWALLRIRDALAKARRRTAASRELLAEYEAAADALRESIAAIEADAKRTADHFTAKLVDWHRRVLVDDPKATSIKLGCGLLKSRLTTGRVLSVADPEVLPAELQRTKVEADKTAIKSWIKDTGETPSGVSWEPPHRNHEVVL